MARLTNHFENDGDMGGFTTIKHHDHPHNETGDENEPPQPPAHLIDPATKSAPVPIASATSDLSEVILASPAAGLAPPPSITSEVAGEDDAFGQIGSPRLSSGHSAKLSETLSSPRWSYENLRNQRWSYNSDVMERGVHDLKMLGEREGDGAQQAKHSVDGSATKDELNLTDSPTVLAASRSATSSKSHSASAASYTASSAQPLIDEPDDNDELDGNDIATEKANPSNGHHNAPPSPLVLPQASLADKVELDDQEYANADSNFEVRGLASPVIESESEQDPAMLRDPLMLSTLHSPLMLSPQSYASTMDKLEQEGKSDNGFSADVGTQRSDASNEAISDGTTSTTPSHTHIPAPITTEQVPAAANATSVSEDSKIDSAVAADSPARPKVTWDDQTPRTCSSRRVSHDTFTVGQRRPSILLNGAASTFTSTTASTPSNIGLNGTNKNLNSGQSSLGNGSSKPTPAGAMRPGEYVVGSPTNSNGKLFVTMLLSLCAGYLVIRTVRELLGNWGVQGVLMVLGAALMMRRSI